MTFLPRLLTHIQPKFLILVVCAYGLNQGMGEGLAFFADDYFFTDAPPKGLGLEPARYSEIDAFANIPWQVKSIFGLISDLYPIAGYRRRPYLGIAAFAGCIAWFALGIPSMAMTPALAGLFLFLGNYSIASPDVIIDARVAELSKALPSLATDFQTLCWSSFGIFKILSLLIAPRIYENYGSRPLYLLTTITSLCLVPGAILNWLDEKKMDPTSGTTTTMSTPQTSLLIRLSISLTVVSILTGLIAMWSPSHIIVSLVAGLVATPIVCILVYYYESRIDIRLAKASLYIFLSGVVQPGSPALFYWYRADDINCSLQRPCFSPTFIANLSIIGYVFFVVGNISFNAFLQSWSFRKIYIVTQIFLMGFTMLDLLWVNRVNISLGISDEFFVLGEEIISPVIARWNTLPLFVLAATLAPTGMEASCFATTMGLSNFGVTIGELIGAGLMSGLGIEQHAFDALPTLIWIRTFCKLIPICLVLILIPDGTPAKPPTTEDTTTTTTSINNNTEMTSSIPITSLNGSISSHDGSSRELEELIPLKSDTNIDTGTMIKNNSSNVGEKNKDEMNNNV
jgi:folate/biopterin transporter